MPNCQCAIFAQICLNSQPLLLALAPIEARLVYDTMQCQRSPLHAFVFSLKPILSPKRISVLLLILLGSTFATQSNSHKSRNYDNDML